MDIFVARQPIFDREYNVVAYELLYRNGLENSFDRSISGNVATSIVLTNSFLTFGIQRLVEGKKAFVNFDKHLIISGVAELLDKDQVVIELLETIVPNEQFIQKLKQLKDDGYICAADDYVDGYKYPRLIESCDIVKVDFSKNTRLGIENTTREMKRQKKVLLAEKIETREDYEWARNLGYELFQGYYFARPLLETRKTFSDSAIQYIRLMNELIEKEPNIKKIARIIEIDVSLTYKLLKLVNSSLGLSQEVTSVQHAVALLGLKSFGRWLSLAMVQNIGETKINELSKYSLMRAFMMDRIATATRFSFFRDELVLLGTLSVVDAILEMEMEDILEPLPLSDGVKDSLLGRETIFSDCYNLVLSYEKGNFLAAENYAKNVGYPYRLLSEHYVAAVKYADEMFEELNKENAVI